MNNEPLVSIIIPCYKMGKYIGEALDSVGKQAYENWEVIVVDDCGPEDGTTEIVEAFATSHLEHQIELIRHEGNRGVSAARNTAIHKARGQLLAFLDPDDKWGPKYLMSHVRKLESDPDIAASYTGAKMIDEKGVATGYLFQPNDAQSKGLPESLCFNCFIIPSMVLARKESVISCGGFDEAPEMQHVEDWDLWLRMMEDGSRFSYTPSAGCFWRRHPGASSADKVASKSREEVLRKKHSELLARYSRKLLLQTLQRIEQLEVKQRAYEGSVFFRAGRAITSCVKTLMRR
jgi:teichuronic acid biosynthesis glycosyltransferase TuaG